MSNGVRTKYESDPRCEDQAKCEVPSGMNAGPKIMLLEGQVEGLQKGLLMRARRTCSSASSNNSFSLWKVPRFSCYQTHNVDINASIR